MSNAGAVKDLAYRLWEDAGKPHGRDMDFWLEAERHLAAPAEKPKPKAKPVPKSPVKPAAPAKAKSAAKPKAK